VDTVKGSSQPVSLCGSEVGLAYRSKDNVKPIFISPGHRCDLAYAKEIVIRCLRGYRLPEPLRRAHLLANKHKAYHEKGRARNSSEPV
jgi:deoxyribonuclease V